MMNGKGWFIGILLVISAAAEGQYTKEFRRIFFDAETLLLSGFYDDALSRYKNLLTLDPGNHNILFLCGASSLHLQGREEEALTYLEQAVEGVTHSYKDHNHKETGAPVIAYYMLARAYHLNNEFPEAIQYYQLYQQEGSDEDPVQLEYAALQEQACRRASEVVEGVPAYEFQDVLDQFDEELPSSSHPVVSGDGDILIFLVNFPLDKKIMMTTRNESGYWSRPRVINNEIGMVGETYPACLSYDGKELYLVHKYYSHSDLFISRYESGRWSEAEPLGRHINGRTSETHASISKDGRTLYFTSDQRGGEGSFDIYMSRLDRKGEWGRPTNLGPVINTPFEEYTPFISSNDSILFFSSQGHATIGGADIFYSERQPDGSWGKPANLGYPLNTTADDLFFNPGWDEMDGYYSMQKESDPTSTTISMVIELEPEEVAELPSPDSAVEVSVVQVPVPGERDVLREPVDTGSVDELTKAIEPPVTDEIVQILNKGEGDTARVGGDPVLELQADYSRETGGEEVPFFQTLRHTSIPFDHDSRSLNLAARIEVKKLASLMLFYPDLKIELTGHTDATGTREYNLMLSLERAELVAGYLTQHGIDPERIDVRGVGEKAPVARNSYPDGRDAPLGRFLNRQVQVKLIGKVPADLELSRVFVPAELLPIDHQAETTPDPVLLTIQVKAHTRPLDLSGRPEPHKITEHRCSDGYYRYTYGSYRDYWQAREELSRLRDSEYPDAFIQPLKKYEKACGQYAVAVK